MAKLALDNISTAAYCGIEVENHRGEGYTQEERRARIAIITLVSKTTEGTWSEATQITFGRKNFSKNH